MDFEQIEIDPELAENGFWFTGPDGADDALLLIASVHSKRYRRALAKFYSRTEHVPNVPERLAEIYAMAEGILLNWYGEVYLDRKQQSVPTPYSQSAAVKLLDCDPVRAWIKELASDSRNYRKAIAHGS